MKKSRIIIIVGSNASGKSELGVKLAKKINGEIISADSRQVYKKLDVGSGKVRGRWKNGVFVYKNIPHYCIDIADPKKVFTALDFKKCAEKAIANILSREKTPIIVGGTGFYIDAALGRVKLGEVPPNRALRKKLKNYSTTKLLNYLTKLDPKRAKIIEQKNPRRLIRAIEIAKTNLSTSDVDSWAMDVRRPKIKILWLGIKRPPEELKKRIRARLLKRLPGIIREVKKLHRQDLGWKRLYDLGLEYRYASLYLRGKISKIQLTQQLTSQIWQYAKRQMTWFRRNKKIRWISGNKEALRRAPISITNEGNLSLIFERAQLS